MASFAGGYQVTFTLGGSRSIATGNIVDDVAVTVKRVAEFNNGLAFYEADQRTGNISVDGKTLAPGDAGYLQGALANARAAGLVLDAGRLPAFGQQGVFDLPIGEVRARAVVRRVIPQRGMGIEFIAMDQEDRARLGRMLMPLLASSAGTE